MADRGESIVTLASKVGRLIGLPQWSEDGDLVAFWTLALQDTLVYLHRIACWSPRIDVSLRATVFIRCQINTAASIESHVSCMQARMARCPQRGYKTTPDRLNTERIAPAPPCA